MVTGDAKSDRIHEAELRVGEVLRGKYTLDGLLGVGGMASVYAATHRNGNRVAIKILHREAALSPTLRSRFLREGYLANRVQHHGALSVIDDDFDELGTAYLVMELLSGENLEDRCSHFGGHLEVGEVLHVTHQVLEVLMRAHGKNIVHRDLKPSNLFLEEGGCIKVLDFGIARLYSPSGGPGETAGSPLGTPGFMPPEQARGRSESIGPHSDIWALGATMFFFLTGRFVHPSEGTVSEQLVVAMNEPAPLLSSLRSDLPTSVCELVDRALAFDPEERWPSAAAMREETATVYETVTGHDIRHAPRLNLACPLPVVRRRSDPDASTVGSTTGNGHVRTATPVSTGHTRATRSARGSWVLAAVVAAGLACTAGAVGAVHLATSTTDQPPRNRPPQAATVARPDDSPATAATVASIAPEVVPAASTSVAAETIETQTPRYQPHPRPVPRPVQPVPALRTQAGMVSPAPPASPSSTPTEPLDIFSRRK